MTTSTRNSPTEWKIGAAILAIGLVGIAAWQIASRETPEEQEARIMKANVLYIQAGISAARGSALLNCQRAIKAASKDPANAKVPAVEQMPGGTDYRFQWTSAEPVRVRNGLGLEVPASALCVVDEASGKIKLLTLDGQQLISP